MADRKQNIKFEPRPSKLHVRLNGQWVIAADINPTVERVKSRKRILLAKTDWTQLPDVTHPLKEQWMMWRASVRAVDATGDLIVANNTLIELEQNAPEAL